jgi:hypothetical protein
MAEPPAICIGYRRIYNPEGTTNVKPFLRIHDLWTVMATGRISFSRSEVLSKMQKMRP